MMAVRNRFMKAVFFFRDESKEVLTVKRSTEMSSGSVFDEVKQNIPISPAQALELMSRSSP